KHVCIESYALELAPNEVSSSEIEDRLAPLYEKLHVPFGTLARLSGIKSRHFYDRDVTPSQVATNVARLALDRAGFGSEHVGALFNCSVTRDYFEPATAVLVHRNLGLSEDTMAMDISNACIGFSNGMMVLASMIESGVTKAGVIVSGETLTGITDCSMKRLVEEDHIDREALLKTLPTFTLGSGAAAMVLCHDSIATKGHKIVGAAARSASQFNDLCKGNADFCFFHNGDFNPLMETDSHPLMAAASKLGARTWQDASEVLGWSAADIDHIFCHQVGRQVNEGFYKTMGLPMDKEHTVYQSYGNMVSAAMPSALITHAEDNVLQKGQKVLLTAFGSGLNAIFTGLIW
ncbi:MAG: 3-oxoacyl-ACP synthase III, partial [Deltaproteobacteria bacterium]|nr:3-oxoacyl-ACP synthase III [Deltaproteobacteria bacterium]